MIIIGKHFEFEASHQLPSEECYGACQNMHGHTYKGVVEISGNLNDKGWLVNFKDLKAIINDVIVDICDHNHLNNVFPKDVITTAENMVSVFAPLLREAIAEKLLVQNPTVRLHSITLYETSNSFVRWER